MGVTMRALQALGGREVELREFPLLDPGPGEVRIAVEAVTVCTQWDLHLRHDSPMFPGHRFVFPYAPGQPGHEAAGRIAAVGSDVAGMREGDAVAIWRDPGHDRPGAYADAVIRKASDVLSVPDGIDPWRVAPLELAMCVTAAIVPLAREGRIRGRVAAVGGLGPAGLIAARLLAGEGAAMVIGIDPDPLRRAMAGRLGISAIGLDDLAALPLRPKGAFDIAIDCHGSAGSVEALMDRTREIVALFGVQREEYRFRPLHYDGLRLQGYPGHSREAAEHALARVIDGTLPLDELVTHRLPLDRYAEGIDLLERREAVKVGFDPRLG